MISLMIGSSKMKTWNTLTRFVRKQLNCRRKLKHVWWWATNLPRMIIDKDTIFQWDHRPVLVVQIANSFLGQIRFRIEFSHEDWVCMWCSLLKRIINKSNPLLLHEPHFSSRATLEDVRQAPSWDWDAEARAQKQRRGTVSHSQSLSWLGLWLNERRGTRW